MGFITARVKVVRAFLAERIRYGLPAPSDPVFDEAVFVADGVGGFQFMPLLIRRALREEGRRMTTVMYRWQFGLTGEIFTDLMWYRRNRRMGLLLARRLLAFHRAHPATRVHLVAYSGGAGIAVFALEKLKRPLVETLILACPALSPEYNLGPSLKAVQRAYALVSERDRVLLGIGTRLFGTTDRKYGAAAGKVGFRIPSNATRQDREAYERMRQLRWGPALQRAGHYGGHTGWGVVPLLRTHLLTLLDGEPKAPVEPVPPAEDGSGNVRTA